MAEREDWRNWARAHNGNTVVWINQGRAQNLKAANSNGVCKAITMDWISSYRRYLSDRATFVNKFRAYDDEGNLVTVIPDDFIAKQEEFTLQLMIDDLEYKMALADYKKNTTAKGLKEVDDIVRRARGGADCKRFYRFTDIAEVFRVLRALTKPYYFALALTRKGAGHVIGFEFRPEKNISDNYPKLFEFIDANTGLFAFSTLKDMIDFVELKVWPRQVGNTKDHVVWTGYGAYTKFMLLQYDIGLGGFGLTPEQQLDKELADLLLEAEVEELEKEAEEQYGKDWWKK